MAAAEKIGLGEMQGPGRSYKIGVRVEGVQSLGLRGLGSRVPNGV